MHVFSSLLPKKLISKTSGLVLLLFLLPSLFILEAQSLSETDLNENKNYVSILRYQGKIGNDLIFYDEKGVAVYLQYRIDRWDFAAEKKIGDLRPGAEYKIDWTFKGYRKESDGTFQGITQNNQTPSRIRKIQNIPTGRYISHKVLLPQKIIL
ncbi:MAG: hypothetical protein ABUK01_12605 [Leptospirales bacterium]